MSVLDRSALVRRGARVDVVLVMAVATCTFWAANVAVVKWAISEWQPLAYTADRLVVGTALFCGWVLLRERSLRVERRDLPLLALAGGIGIAGNQISFMYAERYTTATTVSMLMAASPAFAALAAWLAGQERVTPRHWAGLGVAALGVLLVLRGSTGRIDLTSMRGDLLALLMAATWAIYSVLIRPLTRRYSASRISAVVLLFGAPILLGLSFHQVVGQDYGSLGGGAWVAIVYSLFFSLVFTNILWFGAISRAGAPRVTALLPLQPLLGAFFAIVFLGEDLALLQVAGGVVIVGGILLTRRRPEATPVPD